MVTADEAREALAMTFDTLDGTDFEDTGIGWKVSDARVKWWTERDTCPSCGTIVSPIHIGHDGLKSYRHDCDSNVEWTAYPPAEVAS